MRNGADGFAALKIADRRHLLKTYKQCFLGSDAVTWLVDYCKLKGEPCSARSPLRTHPLLRGAGIVSRPVAKGEARPVSRPIAIAFLVRTTPLVLSAQLSCLAE